MLRMAFAGPVEELSKEAFLTAWHSISYLYPGLHPDDYDDPFSGWPRALKRFAAEAWARFEAEELNDEELYPVEAAWCGIFDTMDRAPTSVEIERRVNSAARYGLLPAA